MDSLSNDALLNIFLFLDDLRPIACVCKRWVSLLNNDELWRRKCYEVFSKSEIDEMLKNSLHTGETWRNIWNYKLRRNFPILILGGDDAAHIADIVTSLTEIGCKKVASFRADLREISCAELQQYAAILCYSYNAFLRPANLGNELTKYLQSGKGGIVVMCFTNCGEANRIQGDWRSNELDPISPGETRRSSSPLTSDTIYFPRHPILDGFSNFNGGAKNSRGNGAVNPNARLIANWSDGTPLIAEMEAFGSKIVSLNFFPVSDRQYNGDWPVQTDAALLMANALYYVSKYCPRYK